MAFLALAGSGTYTVRAGDTLSRIAARHGVTTAALARVNGLADPNRIVAGTSLVLPETTSTYVVRSGDTLAAIARRFDTSVASLVKTNALRDANLIRVGQRLAVPGGTSPAPSTSPGAPAERIPSVSSHVVRAGETLAGVARRYGLSVEQIVAANGITRGVIYAGQRLLLSPVATGASGPSTYTVVAGDTLAGIARRLGTTVGAIARENALADPNRIRAGTRLRIPGRSGPGPIVCPVVGARFMNDWGFPRSGGRFHEGTDLFAPRGTPVRAPAAGTVTQVTGRIGGHQVKLVGGDGTAYYATHLDRFGRAGSVGAGDVIGYVGNSGNAVGGPTHVHFELRPAQGSPVNPYPTLLAAC